MFHVFQTNKHKFFVLHKDSATAPARLEYYNTESQWIKRKKAKRTIYLSACFRYKFLLQNVVEGSGKLQNVLAVGNDPDLVMTHFGDLGWYCLVLYCIKVQRD